MFRDPGMVAHTATHAGGIGGDIRAQADWLANEGLFAVAPDLYYLGTRLRCLRTIATLLLRFLMR